MDNNKNEIDILELLIKIFIYLKKYLWLFIAVLIISVLFTIIMNSIQPKNFESSMVIKTSPEKDYMYAMTFQEFTSTKEENTGELIEKILKTANSFRYNGNFMELEKRTRLDEKTLVMLKSINTEYKYSKGEAVSNYITIIGTARDKKIFEVLGNGIVNFINSNKSIQDKNYRDSVFLTEVISKLDIKINELDVLQQKFSETGKINDFFIFKSNSFFEENIKLTSLREQLSLDLKELKQAEIVEDFYMPIKDSKILSKSILINILIALFVLFIIVFILIINKKANEYKKKLKE